MICRAGPGLPSGFGCGFAAMAGQGLPYQEDEEYKNAEKWNIQNAGRISSQNKW